MVTRRFISIVSSAVFATALLLGGSAGPAAAAKTYANCTALNKVYPHGVGKQGAHDHVSSGTPVTNFKRSNELYAANSSKDRDNDKVACEKH